MSYCDLAVTSICLILHHLCLRALHSSSSQLKNLVACRMSALLCEPISWLFDFEEIITIVKYQNAVQRAVRATTEKLKSSAVQRLRDRFLSFVFVFVFPCEKCFICHHRHLYALYTNALNSNQEFDNIKYSDNGS